jgi:hypothetical protein
MEGVEAIAHLAHMQVGVAAELEAMAKPLIHITWEVKEVQAYCVISQE